MTAVDGDDRSLQQIPALGGNEIGDTRLRISETCTYPRLNYSLTSRL